MPKPRHASKPIVNRGRMPDRSLPLTEDGAVVFHGRLDGGKPPEILVFSLVSQMDRAKGGGEWKDAGVAKETPRKRGCFRGGEKRLQSMDGAVRPYLRRRMSSS